MRTLKDLESALNKEKYPSHLIDSDEALPYERLIVFLGTDYKQRERLLEITLQQQELAEGLMHPIPGYVRIQFQSTLPFDMGDLATNQVAALLLFLNQLLELPGFEMIEISNKIRYRYVLLTDARGIDEKVCFAIIGMIMLILTIFTEAIEKVASGTITFNDLLEDVLDAAQELKTLD